MKQKILFTVFVAFGVFLTANAQVLEQSPTSSVISAYRSYKEVGTITSNTPTVVEVPFPNEFIERSNFAVLDTTTNKFEPYFFKQEILTNEIPVSIRLSGGTSPLSGSASSMTDGNTRTYTDFVLPISEAGSTQLVLESTKPVTASAITVLLENNVALPNTVAVSALVDNQDRIIVANRKMDQQTIRFPKTTSNKWTISFTFGQLLRISELKLQQDNVTKTSIRAVRFLAQPGHSYRIYFDPDRSVNAPVGEAGNLASAKDVLAVSAPTSANNPNYIVADIDNDGTPDTRDNCVSVFNADQQDINGNGRGDVCDDFDQDGLSNSKDNCPNNPNRDQRDTDGDGMGDICDGKESRITEQYTWLPWVGIGSAALVLVVLLVLTARSTPLAKREDETPAP